MKSLIEEIEYDISKYVDVDSDVKKSAERMIYRILKVIERKLDMEFSRGEYEPNGNFEADFNRFGVGRVELSVHGNTRNEKITLLWNIVSLEGYVRKVFYTPYTHSSSYWSFEELIGKLKKVIEYFTGEKIILETPEPKQKRLITLYTKTYTISVVYNVHNMPDSLLVRYSINGLTLSKRGQMRAIG